METKVCYQCGQEKSLSDYKRVGVNASPMRNCRECYTSNRRNNRETGVKFDQKHYYFEDNYGITFEEYQERLDLQGGVCAICDSPPPEGQRKKFLCVDHDHETGEVRGILCDSCNRGIGLLGDNVDRLSIAISYLNQNLHFQHK